MSQEEEKRTQRIGNAEWIGRTDMQVSGLIVCSLCRQMLRLRKMGQDMLHLTVVLSGWF